MKERNPWAQKLEAVHCQGHKASRKQWRTPETVDRKEGKTLGHIHQAQVSRCCLAVLLTEIVLNSKYGVVQMLRVLC